MATRAWIGAGLGCALALAACGGGPGGETVSHRAVAAAATRPIALSSAPGTCPAVTVRTLHAIAARIEARAAAARGRPVRRPPTLVARLTGAPVHACGATAPHTVAETVGAVGERLLRAEAHGPAVARALRLVAHDRGLVAAVRRRDAAALRTAIVRFFRIRRLHIVRIRAVTASGRLVGDVGGPYVLAPASRTIRAGGRRVGGVMLSIQDDAGYVKLMRRFTGARVVLRTRAGVVPVSARPPRGGRVERFSFATRAFPAGRLHVALYVPLAAR